MCTHLLASGMTPPSSLRLAGKQSVPNTTQVGLVETLHAHLKGKPGSAAVTLGGALEGRAGYGGVCADGEGAFLKTALLYLSSQQVKGNISMNFTSSSIIWNDILTIETSQGRSGYFLKFETTIHHVLENRLLQPRVSSCVPILRTRGMINDQTNEPIQPKQCSAPPPPPHATQLISPRRWPPP